jgi:hypothetical protein
MLYLMHFPAAWLALHLFPLLELVLPGIAVGEYAWDLDPPQYCHRRQAAVYACVVIGPEGCVEWCCLVRDSKQINFFERKTEEDYLPSWKVVSSAPPGRVHEVGCTQCRGIIPHGGTQVASSTHEWYGTRGMSRGKEERKSEEKLCKCGGLPCNPALSPSAALKV